MDPSCFLTSSDFVCTVCIFSKAFEADHKSIGLPVKGRTCIFTGYPPPLQLQSGLLCTCITETPNKTHCGRLVRKTLAASASGV